MNRTHWCLKPLIAGALVCLSLPSFAATPPGNEADPFVFALWLRSPITSLSFLDIYQMDPLTIESQIMEGLMGFEPGGDNEPKPALAQTVIQIDPVTYVFRLRPGILFHTPPDGEVLTEPELTSVDVKFSLDLARKSKNLIAGPLRDIERMVVADKYLIKIKLRRPVDDFLRVMASSIAHVTSKEYYESLGPDAASRRAAFARHPIGTGPFRLAHSLDREGSTTIVIERSPNYRQTSSRTSNGTVERVEFHLFAELQEIDLARRAGDVDAATLPLTECSADVAREEASSSVTLLDPPYLSILAINNTRGALRDARIRRLLNATVDAETIRAICPSRETSWNRSVHYYLQLPELYFGQKTRRRVDQLLAEPGMPDLVAELKANGLVLLAAETYDEISDQIVQSVKDSIAGKLGIEVRIDRSADLGSEIKENQYDLLYAEVAADLPTLSEPSSHTDLVRYMFSIPRELFLSQSPINFAHYSSTEVDRLLEEDIQRVFDNESANRIHRELQQHLIEDAPFIWLPTVRHSTIVLGADYQAPWVSEENSQLSNQVLNSSFLRDVRQLNDRIRSTRQ